MKTRQGRGTKKSHTSIAKRIGVKNYVNGAHTPPTSGLKQQSPISTAAKREDTSKVARDFRKSPIVPEARFSKSTKRRLIKRRTHASRGTASNSPGYQIWSGKIKKSASAATTNASTLQMAPQVRDPRLGSQRRPSVPAIQIFRRLDYTRSRGPSPPVPGPRRRRQTVCAAAVYTAGTNTPRNVPMSASMLCSEGRPTPPTTTGPLHHASAQNSKSPSAAQRHPFRSQAVHRRLRQYVYNEGRVSHHRNNRGVRCRGYSPSELPNTNNCLTAMCAPYPCPSHLCTERYDTADLPADRTVDTDHNFTHQRRSVGPLAATPNVSGGTKAHPPNSAEGVVSDFGGVSVPSGIHELARCGSPAVAATGPQSGSRSSLAGQQFSSGRVGSGNAARNDDLQQCTADILKGAQIMTSNLLTFLKVNLSNCKIKALNRICSDRVPVKGSSKPVNTMRAMYTAESVRTEINLNASGTIESHEMSHGAKQIISHLNRSILQSATLSIRRSYVTSFHDGVMFVLDGTAIDKLNRSYVFSESILFISSPLGAKNGEGRLNIKFDNIRVIRQHDDAMTYDPTAHNIGMHCTAFNAAGAEPQVDEFIQNEDEHLKESTEAPMAEFSLSAPAVVRPHSATVSEIDFYRFKSEDEDCGASEDDAAVYVRDNVLGATTWTAVSDSGGIDGDTNTTKGDDPSSVWVADSRRKSSLKALECCFLPPLVAPRLEEHSLCKGGAPITHRHSYCSDDVTPFLQHGEFSTAPGQHDVNSPPQPASRSDESPIQYESMPKFVFPGIITEQTEECDVGDTSACKTEMISSSVDTCCDVEIMDLSFNKSQKGVEFLEVASAAHLTDAELLATVNAEASKVSDAEEHYTCRDTCRDSNWMEEIGLCGFTASTPIVVRSGSSDESDVDVVVSDRTVNSSTRFHPSVR